VVQTQLWVESDPLLLRRILQNLLGNAFRYASPGKILLGVRRHKGCAQIQVLDNGPGIPLEQQQRVFEQFTQLETGDARGAKGLGLGLNITRSFAQLLEHPLSLRSAAGKGCNFSVEVPIQAPDIKQEVIPKMLGQVNLQGVTVMCIDNDPAVLNGMIELLTAWKCNVISAGSSVEAKFKFQQHFEEIEILLVDYQLENNNDGLSLIKDLRAAHVSAKSGILPAILITATTEQGIDVKAQNMDVGFMKKLVKPAALRAMMSAKLAESLQQSYARS